MNSPTGGVKISEPNRIKNTVREEFKTAAADCRFFLKAKFPEILTDME